MPLIGFQALSRALDRLGRSYVRLVAGAVRFSARRATWVVAALLALSALSAAYTADHFAITTDVRALLSTKLPFQQHEAAYRKAFPQLSDTIVVVIDGAESGLAREAADRLDGWLAKQPSTIASVYQPGGGAFFEKNGLLYLGRDELWTLSNRLAAAEPMLVAIARKPALPQLLGLLGQAFGAEGRAAAPLGNLNPVLVAMEKTVAAGAAGKTAWMPWSELIGGQTEGAGERRAFLIVKPKLDYGSLQPAARSLATIRAGIKALGLGPANGVQVRLTGSAALDNDQFQSVSRGAGIATALSISLVLLLLFIAFRSIRFVLASLVTLFMGLTWTAAFALAALGPLNLISVAFAVLFVGLGVDFGIQFCVRFREDWQGDEAIPAGLQRTAAGIAGPLSLAAVAAACSFYSFIPTSYSGIVDLGLISGTSMFFALFASLTALPAFLTLFRVQRRPIGRTVETRIASRIGRRTAIGVVVAAGLVAAAAVPLALTSHFDFNPMNLQNPNSEAVATFRKLLQQSKTSPYTIELLEPNLQAAQKLAARLAALPSVSRALTLASYIPDDQTAKLNVIAQMGLLIPPMAVGPLQPTAPPEIAAALRKFADTLVAYNQRPDADPKLLPQTRRLAATLARFLDTKGKTASALGALERHMIGSLPYLVRTLMQEFDAAPVTLASLPADLKSRYVDAKGQARIELFSRLDLGKDDNLRRFVTDVRSIAPNATGAPVLLVDGGDAVVTAFIQATAISLGLIVLLLLIVLRDPLDVVVVVLPLGFAALLTVATMRLFGLSFDLANIIALPLLIGLAIAFSIYLIMRWRRGMSMPEVLKTSTPKAVLLSALTTMSSFGSLAISSDPGMAILGETLTIALCAVIVAILVLQPALLFLRRPAALVGDGAPDAS